MKAEFTVKHGMHPCQAGGSAVDEAGWLRDWCQENVNFTSYDDEEEARQLAHRAEQDARQDCISISKALEEEGYASLERYMLDMLNRRADEEVA
jgi:hypothetical protein